MDFYKVYFEDTTEFVKFFEIESRGSDAKFLLSFSKHFAKFISKEKTIKREHEAETRLLGSRAEGNEPNII